jgi:hypothetical protein
LSPFEANFTVRLAARLARERTGFDVEEQRSLMIIRLEEFARRSRRADNLRNELNAYKLLALVQGLGKVEPEDEQAAFVRVVRGYNRDREARIAGPEAAQEEGT